MSTTTALFDNFKFEPGAVKVVYLRVSNQGTLALNYQLSLLISSETKGTNSAGKEFALSDVLHASLVSVTEVYENRQAAINSASPDGYLLKNMVTEKDQLSQGKTATYALTLYLPDGTSNDYNSVSTVPQIDIGINLNATQAPEESDSFDNTYDTAAPLVTLVNRSNVLNKLSNGGVIVMERSEEPITDVNLANASTEKTELNLSGNTISLNNNGTVLGNGKTVDFTFKNGTIATPFTVKKGNVTLDNIVFQISEEAENQITSGKYSGTVMNIDDNASAVLTDCISKGRIAGSGDVTINGGDYVGLTINGGNWVINSGTFHKTVFKEAKYAVSLKDAKLTVNGGEFKALDVPVFFAASGHEGIEINGGTFRSPVFGDTYSTELYKIKGGTFYNWNPTRFVPEGYTVATSTDTGETSYTVSAVN